MTEESEVVGWYVLDKNGEKSKTFYNRVAIGEVMPSRAIVIGSQDDIDVKEIGRPRWW